MRQVGAGRATARADRTRDRGLRHGQAAWQKNPQLPALLHAARVGGGLLAVAEEVVGPHRAADGAAGVLRDGQALHGRAAARRARRHEHRVAQRRAARIDRDRAACRQRHAEGAHRAARGRGRFLEEHVARVLDAGAGHRAGRATARHHHRAAGRGPRQREAARADHAVVDGARVFVVAVVQRQLERAAAHLDRAARLAVGGLRDGRAEGLAVLLGVGHAHDLAAGQLDAARALDLHLVQRRGAAHEGQHLGIGRALGLDLFARVVRQQALAVDAQAHLAVERVAGDGRQVERVQARCAHVARAQAALHDHVAALDLRGHRAAAGRELARIDEQHVLGLAVDRVDERRDVGAAARDLGLEVAGDHAVGLAVVVADLVGRELALEEAANRLRALAVDLQRALAHLFPLGAAAVEHLAAAQEGRPAFREVVARPARHGVEADRGVGGQLGREGARLPRHAAAGGAGRCGRGVGRGGRGGGRARGGRRRVGAGGQQHQRDHGGRSAKGKREVRRR
ncbi:hypothetical protein FQZ97_685290 [compost metagenome]